MDPEAKKMWGIVASTGAVGLEIAVAIGIGYLGGQYLDRKLGVAPWFMWVGFAAGVGQASRRWFEWFAITRRLSQKKIARTRNEQQKLWHHGSRQLDFGRRRDGAGRARLG